MLYHKTCKGILFVKQQSIVLSSSITVGYDGIGKSTPELTSVPNGKDVLYCPTCGGKPVPISEVEGQDAYTGELLPPEQLVTVQGQPGMYTLANARELFDHARTRPVIDILKEGIE